ncbi:unnamed protein product [Clonostachys rosea f. rosea IK726]|uniref:Uncharacterized protein n=1 Tax=Clonostachys rosea f. rosea IK726 TaxID=1349383 RepID=A0ACA9U844_BIOOC|nr:unnamed protein product [Clonostachys rosea f. rosea IK726]
MKEILMKEITSQRNLGLDLAILRIWPAYRRTQGEIWTTQESCWLRTTSSNQDGSSAVEVHYNVITAKLLVSGIPLGRLTSEYEAHQDYSILFGLSSVEVVPSAEPGMDFSSRRIIEGHQVHLAYDSQQKDLLVRACKENTTWELVPSRVFEKNIPSHFINHFTHWYDVTNHVVEFRLHDKPWKHDDSSWRLRKCGSQWLLEQSRRSLINPSSETALWLSNVFSPIEKPSALHVFFNWGANSLVIEIPRLQLEFYIDAGSDNIMSRQYRGMRVDPQQSIGTLIGLVDKLALVKVGESQNRLVLIPDWAPDCQKSLSNNHVMLTIPSFATRIQAYQLNHHLHCLIGNGSLKSKLFLAELHALTSNLVEDPFTLHTGTEEALNILRSEGVRSFDCLSQEEIDILNRIGNLSPKRNFYPDHLKVMQIVTWDFRGLSPLSQHVDFRKSVRDLFDQASATSFFYKDSVSPQLLDSSLPELEDREAIRSSVFYRAGYGAESHTTAHDIRYHQARNGDQSSDRALRVTKVAAAFNDFKAQLPFKISGNAPQNLYQKLSNYPINSPSKSTPERLSFDARWVGNSLPQLREAWGGIQRSLQSTKSSDHFSLLPWMVSLAFAKDSDKCILSILVGLIFHPEHRVMVFPSKNPLELDEGHEFDLDWVRKCIQSFYISFELSGKDNKQDVHRGESRKAAFERRKRHYQSEQTDFTRRFEEHIRQAWRGEISMPQSAQEGMAYVRVSNALGAIRARCRSWYNNHLFLESLERMCTNIGTITVQSIQSILCDPITESLSALGSRSVSRYITINDLLVLAENTRNNPGADYAIQPPDIVSQAESSSAPHTVSTLGARVATLARLPQEIRYVEKLNESIHQLRQNIQQSRLTTDGKKLQPILSNYYQSCLERYNDVFRGFKDTLVCSAYGKDSITSISIAEGTVVWPTVSPRVILKQMNRSNWKNLSQGWRKAVVNFGCCLAQLQGAERLLQLHEQEVDLVKELSNLGHRIWDPMEHPDSLLLEIEGNLRIRKVQQGIAEIMECPPNSDKKNVVMQLNMGEGKSSVIVPIVAAALGDGSNLVRIIVGKPQSRQMFEMLVSKLGGLIGRRVYHMPFSRSIRPNSDQAKFMQHHYQECRLQGGVLLLQPENILSFQLIVLEAAIKEEMALSDSLIRTQVDFFDKYSRDIIDESDENFSVKFELIYTMGLQGPIDYAPERWAVVQQVLGLVYKYAVKVSKNSPKSIEVYVSSQGRCPRIRFLDQDASSQVLSLVVDHVCEYGLLPGFPVSRLSKASRDDVREYISNPLPSPEVIANVEGMPFWATASSSLVLIRGLFARSILDFVFSKKRWRVNYGLDATREPKTRLAVPYRAKDNPSQRSEFSQPEVVIALTSISYYYGGLTDDELFLSFNHLFKSDQADGEYQSWVQSIPNLPEAFSQLEGVNITDKHLCINRLFPHLRYCTSVIDYFLSKIVFVKEIKEFPHKLSASGWDLGRIKTLPATGFSGTNDSQHVLPLTVKQLDLPTQMHTNALVLENLLRPENSVTVLSEWEDHNSTWNAMQLLELTVKMEPETRVILDVGAQIIDLSNQDVAEAWLKLVQEKGDIQAVVFCNDDDELSVLDRQGQVELLQTSPFAKHLDTCLVFLDEAHTRGIDLRLPQNYRAAVTLGANLVKDRLVQACMRMRKLGHGQSVVFYVPEEIETKIRGLNRTINESLGAEPITVLDVLAWSISETWEDIRRSFPIWATQGNTFARHQYHWKSMSGSNGQPVINKGLAEKFLENEAQSLERRYRPHSQQSTFIDDMAQSQDPMLQQIFQRYREFSNLDLTASSLREEQERELAPEVEEERQKERAKPAQALQHKIHSDVEKFVLTGVIRPSSKALKGCFELFGDTSAGNEFEVYQWPKGLLITEDFARTVKKEEPLEGSYMDDFLRSVQWILTSSTSGFLTMVVISPFEANKLRDEIANSQAVVRHLYGPRQNQGFAPIDGLNLYTLPGSALRHGIPRNLIIELNLFSGQLYFRSFQEYKEVCDYLGLAWKAAEDGQVIMPDGFIQRPPGDDTCAFKTSPVKFLKVALSKIRLNCEGIEKTHLGKVLEGALLTVDDFRPGHY